MLIKDRELICSELHTIIVNSYNYSHVYVTYRAWVLCLISMPKGQELMAHITGKLHVPVATTNK